MSVERIQSAHYYELLARINGVAIAVSIIAEKDGDISDEAVFGIWHREHAGWLAQKIIAQSKN